MAVTYLEPIPELRAEKARQFEKNMKDVKPAKFSEKEIKILKSLKIAGQHLYETDK